MKPRGLGQKSALWCAWISYFGAVVAVLAAGYVAATGSTADPIFAALAASVVFCCGCGIVLQVIGSVDLPDLRIER